MAHVCLLQQLKNQHIIGSIVALAASIPGQCAIDEIFCRDHVRAWQMLRRLNVVNGRQSGAAALKIRTFLLLAAALSRLIAPMPAASRHHSCLAYPALQIIIGKFCGSAA
jgi:hypothetical protein